MKSFSIKSITSIFLSLLIVNSSELMAGSLVTMNVESSNENGRGFEQTFSLQDGKLRFDQSNGNNSSRDNNSSQATIWDSNSSSLLIINHNEKSYSIIDQASLQQLKVKLGDAKRLMDEQMAKIPPAQREMMKKMMGENMPGFGGDKPQVIINVAATGRNDSVAGYACDIREIVSNGQKIGEVCVTPWDKLKNGTELAAAFKPMMAFFKDFMQSLNENLPIQIDFPMAELEALDGMPVRNIEYQQGKPKGAAQLKSIISKTFDSTLFEPPAGYTKNVPMI